MNEEFLNKVLHGDCLEWMKEIEDKSIDMILCDLPYGTTDCKWDSIIPFDELWENYSRVVKDNGAIVLTSAQPFTSALILSNPKMFKYLWTWNKRTPTNHMNAKKQPLRITEDITVFYKKQPTYNPQLRDREKKNIRKTKKTYSHSSEVYSKKTEFGFNSRREIPLDKGYPINLIEIPQVGNYGKKRLHPSQKPIELFEYLIKTYSNEGDLVLDNCLGSGTTAVASINTNRNFIGIEQEWDYCNIANERIKQAKEQKENSLK